ncbi:MAG TPA: hypothetical protein VGR92_15320 [Steroidobacteraceae bacterium]|nr:hypothetical protein [Steroidobacteraceae bacterium]
MARHRGPVLVDTNIILECWRIGAWSALTGGYAVETVEDCVTETQTGFQRRRKEQQIDAAALRASLARPPHPVTEHDLAEALLRAQDIYLDVGERSLWAHALTRTDAWVLCGPDRASLRYGVRVGCRERIISLEALLEGVGYSAKGGLERHFTTKWLSAILSELVVHEENRS